jgi:hypothetical protein
MLIGESLMDLIRNIIRLGLAYDSGEGAPLNTDEAVKWRQTVFRPKKQVLKPFLNSFPSPPLLSVDGTRIEK